jgi:hypothetical protein
MVTHGAITGLDCKLAATLLKTMTLLDGHQIGMFAALYAIRMGLSSPDSIGFSGDALSLS